MVSSSYYYKLYKQYKSQAGDYEKNVTSLTKIKNSLNGDLSDEQSGVNNKLNDLKDDLSKSVRHDSTFSSNANSCSTNKEKSSALDGTLSSAITSLENEINALNRKKTEATSKSTEYYNKYTKRKEEEKQELLEALKSAF